MNKERTIVDIHIHIFNQIEGRNSDGPTSSLSFGKVKTGAGEMQFMPPYSRETSFPADVIVEMMDYAGISKAVLLQNPLIGIVNDVVADAIEEYPERFIGTIQVDPLDPEAVETIKKYSANPRHYILKFEMSDGWGWCGIHKNLKLDDECFTPIWELASERNLPIILDGGRPNNTGYQVEAIDRVTTMYPDLTFILEHLGSMNKENFHLKNRWYEMIQLGKKKNVYLGIAAIGAGLREDFPCFQALELLKEGVQLVGAEKILWGSDIPGTLKFFTYRQMADMILTYTSFLSEEEKDLIMGGNALRILTGFK
jgi:predicted TIM-barrel fold metal-dependent hydrolase